MSSSLPSKPSSSAKTDSASEDDYYLQIESHFSSRRGTPFIFSAKDWALLQQWKESGIPLPLVIEAIDQCFEKKEKGGRRRTISSLRYCRHAVTEIWEERKELLVGSAGDIPEIDPYSRLSEIADAILARAAETDVAISSELSAASQRMRAIPAGRSIPQIEDELLRIEQELIDRLLAILPARVQSELEQEVEQELAGYSAKSPSVQEKTRAANLLRLLRRRLSLPRLSLFS
jgi:hypothetical protein